MRRRELLWTALCAAAVRPSRADTTGLHQILAGYDTSAMLVLHGGLDAGLFGGVKGRD
jgi:hypothetical protein